MTHAPDPVADVLSPLAGERQRGGYGHTSSFPRPRAAWIMILLRPFPVRPSAVLASSSFASRPQTRRRGGGRSKNANPVVRRDAHPSARRDDFSPPLLALHRANGALPAHHRIAAWPLALESEVLNPPGLRWAHVPQPVVVPADELTRRRPGAPGCEPGRQGCPRRRLLRGSRRRRTSRRRRRSGIGHLKT